MEDVVVIYMLRTRLLIRLVILVDEEIDDERWVANDIGVKSDEVCEEVDEGGDDEVGDRVGAEINAEVNAKVGATVGAEVDETVDEQAELAAIDELFLIGCRSRGTTVKSFWPYCTPWTATLPAPGVKRWYVVHGLTSKALSTNVEGEESSGGDERE